MFKKKVSARALNEVAGMNRAFLSLATSGPRACTRFGLEDDIVLRLHLLESDPMRRLAAVPFSLFSLALHDAAAWDSVLDRRVRDESAPTCWARDGSSEQQFMIIALGGIRDIAGRDPQWASLLFGADPTLANSLAGVEIARLPALADSARPWLRARLAADREWWDALILSACRGGLSGGDRELGIHRTLQRALNLREARLPRGRICRKQ